MWKAFLYWKKLIRHMKTETCQKVLGENLFMLNHHLRAPLLRLMELCYSVSTWDLFSIDRWKTVTLQVRWPNSVAIVLLTTFWSRTSARTSDNSAIMSLLCSRRRTRRWERIAAVLISRSSSRQVRAIVLDACDRDLRAFLAENGFGSGEQEEEDGSSSNAGGGHEKISHAEKAAIRSEVSSGSVPFRCDPTRH
jgi:hypothetical protein